jgi:anti-sigma regulatory factor (Ser/Thr protein kinase)
MNLSPGHTDTHTVQGRLGLEVTPVPGAPSLGRRALERLAGAVAPSELADLQLIASELISNSVLHAGLDQHELVSMRVAVSGSAVRIEVEDPGRGFTPQAVPESGMDRGHGLALVDRVATRWGIVRAGTTVVWAEIDHRQAAAA